MDTKNGVVTFILAGLIFLMGLHIINEVSADQFLFLNESLSYVTSEFLLSKKSSSASADTTLPIVTTEEFTVSPDPTAQAPDFWAEISLPQTIDPALYASSKEYTDALYQEALSFFDMQELHLPWENFLCIGDSVTIGVQSGMNSPWPISYPEVISDLYHIPVDNQGIGGSAICSSGSFPMVTRIADCAYADAVFVMGGLNDWFLTCPIGSFTQPSTFTYDLNVFYHYIKKMYVHSDVFIIIPMSPLLDDETIVSYDFEEIRDLERSLSREYGFYVIDLAAQNVLCAEDPEIKQTYYSDGCHPNSIGYNVLGTIIAYEAIRIKCENP